jgi:fatty-acyl-CoA synthase
VTRLPFSGAHWVDHLARHAFSQPDGVALRFEGRSLTWGDLHRRVSALAAGLAELGVRRGDRVALLMSNRPEVIEAVIAANALGAIAVPLNFRLAPAEVEYVLGDSQARILLTDPGLAAIAEAAAARAGIPSLSTGPRYEAIVARGAAPPEVEIDERDVALIMYTSGTTGRPKGAMLTHLNLLMQAVSMIRTHRLCDADEVYLQNVPLFHVAGIGTMPAPLLNGTRTVLMPTGAFDPGQTLDVVEREGVTAMFLVPAQWQALCEHPEASAKSRSLRVLSWGAAPAPLSLLERMHEVFGHAEVVSVFGQTEMSPPTASLPDRDARRKLGSVGRHVPTIAVRIVDEEMRDVLQGEVGEIVYRGPTLMAGYWNDPERTAEAFAGGWFHSGDLVRADEDGCLTVVDRKKDMIISGGENIYCAEVESALAGHPAIAEVAVIGAPDERWGETPVAVVVPAGDAVVPPADELRRWLRPHLAGYKLPTRVVAVYALPRNAAGKVLKHELRAAHG